MARARATTALTKVSSLAAKGVGFPGRSLRFESLRAYPSACDLAGTVPLQG